MPWFSKSTSRKLSNKARRSSIAEGIWCKCESCAEIVYTADIERNLDVCPLCDHHFAMPMRRRLDLLLDTGSFDELDDELWPTDPLGFTDSKRYCERLRDHRESLGDNEAFVGGMGRLGGHLVSVGGFSYSFMGGSMGSVVGEKVTRVFERGYEKRCPTIVFSASGGARMQEGVFALMQMAKTSSAVARFKKLDKPFISVMLNPTTGGVAASFAWLGDVILAEPRALIGFAGPRVIEQTIGEKLPEGFQRSESVMRKGMIDMIIHRRAMRDSLARLLDLLG